MTIHFGGVSALMRFGVLTLALGPGTANAATLNLHPLDSTLSQINPIPFGSKVALVLDIEEMDKYPVSGDPGSSTTYVYTSERLGAYDIRLSYDPDKLTFAGGSFGTGLGATLFNTMSADPLGNLNLVQISQETIASLLANQPRVSFTLVTLDFIVNLHGNGDETAVNFNGVDLSDERGEPLSFRGSSSTYVYGENQIAAVPLPATWLLFAAGLAIVAGARGWSVQRGKA